MARGWFLEPLQILRKAFELGFQAAQAPDAMPLAVQASAAAGLGVPSGSGAPVSVPSVRMRFICLLPPLVSEFRP